MAIASFTHADVFASGPYRGNSLGVFQDAEGIDARQRQTITQELRHYESVFLHPTDDATRYRAFINTLEEEVDFAGHPLLGAAAVLHRNEAPNVSAASWTFDLNYKSVTVTSERRGAGWWVEMVQGRPQFLGLLPPSRRDELLAAINCRADDLHADLPIEIVSLGLAYVLVPLCRGLDQARIVHGDFANLLKSMGAQFVYLFDVDASEGRTWNNDGVVEDVATGSAAGPLGAYLTKRGRLRPGSDWTLHQGGLPVGQAS